MCGAHCCWSVRGTLLLECAGHTLLECAGHIVGRSHGVGVPVWAQVGERFATPMKVGLGYLGSFELVTGRKLQRISTGLVGGVAGLLPPASGSSRRRFCMQWLCGRACRMCSSDLAGLAAETVVDDLQWRET